MTTEKQIKTIKNKSLVKKETRIQKITDENVRDIMLNETSKIAGNPDLLIKELETALEKVAANQGKMTPRAKKEELRRIAEIFMKVEMAYGLETHYPLLQLVADKYLPLTVEFAKQLTAEYDCKTPSERALVQITVIAYEKILEFTERLFDNLNANDPWLSHEKNGLKSVLGKELDRANRHFLNALTTLKQFKAPSFEINVKTKTAFVAQNQQINANNQEIQQKDENIEPK